MSYFEAKMSLEDLIQPPDSLVVFKGPTSKGRGVDEISANTIVHIIIKKL